MSLLVLHQMTRAYLDSVVHRYMSVVAAGWLQDGEAPSCSLGSAHLEFELEDVCSCHDKHHQRRC